MMVLHDLIKEYKDELIRQDKSKHTIAAYINDIDGFWNWYAETTTEEFTRVMALDLQDYRSYLINTKQEKATTVNRKITSINNFFKWLYNNDTIEKSLELKHIKTQNNHGFKGLSITELKKLKREIHRNGIARDIAIFEVLVGTGLRVSELCGIRLSHIIISERKGQVTVLGKGMAERVLSLPQDAREAISNYLKVRPSGTDFLFVGQRGQLTRSSVYKILQVYGNRIGIEISPHVLRHTMARRLLESNDITTVQGILGHKRLETTAIYTKTDQGKMDSALEKLDWN